MILLLRPPKATCCCFDVVPSSLFGHCFSFVVYLSCCLCWDEDEISFFMSLWWAVVSSCCWTGQKNMWASLDKQGRGCATCPIVDVWYSWRYIGTTWMTVCAAKKIGRGKSSRDEHERSSSASETYSPKTILLRKRVLRRWNSFSNTNKYYYSASS